jgi:hypothetical protein
MAADRWRRIVASLFAVLSAAIDAQPLASPGAKLSLPNCVSDTRLELAAVDERALLDDEDRDGLGRLLQQRYPAVAGLTPDAIVLWRRNGGAWVYLALVKSSGHAGGWCHAASFSADPLGVTPALLRKYFAGGAQRA